MHDDKHFRIVLSGTSKCSQLNEEDPMGENFTDFEGVIKADCIHTAQEKANQLCDSKNSDLIGRSSRFNWRVKEVKLLYTPYASQADKIKELLYCKSDEVIDALGGIDCINELSDEEFKELHEVLLHASASYFEAINKTLSV